MGRYYASEALRSYKLQKITVNYGVRKAHPAVQKISSKYFDQLSTKIRPNIKYETDRPDLGGSGIMDGLLKSGVFGSPYLADLKKGYEILSNTELFAPVNKKPLKDDKKLV